MKRIPFLVLFAGVVATGAGVMLLWASSLVEGLIWLAGPVTAGGLILIVFWLLRFRRGTGIEQDEP